MTRDERERDWLSDEPLPRALVDLGRADEAPEGLEERLVERLCAGSGTASFTRARQQELGPAGAMPVLESPATAAAHRRRISIVSWAAAALVFALIGVWRLGERVELTADPVVARTPPRESALPAPITLPLRCANPVRVGSAQALIDDFEDGNSRVFAHAGRSGIWQLVVAGSAADVTERVVPELLESGAGGQRALRVAVPAVDRWGAALAVNFGRCQDASLFQGVRFKARGPATLRVKVNMAEVVDRRHGGTCLDDCYHAHAREVVTSESFATYTVRFDELEQPSATPAARRLPFRADSLQGIAFAVDAQARPLEFWIDDIELVAREQ